MTWILVTVALLMLAAPAHADTWDFSWTSNGIPGHSTATIAADPNFAGLIGIHYDGPGSTGGYNIAILTGPPRAQGSFPMFFTPWSPIGYGDPRWLSVYTDAPGAYAWTGAFDHPDSFTITGATFGGSPRLPMAGVFDGTGTLVSAPEPEGLLSVLGVALALAGWRASRRTARAY